MVKVFTIVKGEVDIVEDWVLYHGYLFGFTNLYVIDNYSRDGTYQKLLELQKKFKINVTRLPDYKRKGEYMTYFMRKFCGHMEIAIPMDIDEFIVYYDRNTNTMNCNSGTINSYLRNLPLSPVFKMNYINAKLLTENGYEDAAAQTEYGSYSDYKDFAKSFFRAGIFKGIIDHGNHYVTENYHSTNLCLIHFHCRNLIQMQKKVYNNVNGLGYDPHNVNELKNLFENKVPGWHHVEHQIKILENTYHIKFDTHSDDDISLSPFTEVIMNIRKMYK